MPKQKPKKNIRLNDIVKDQEQFYPRKSLKTIQCIGDALNQFDEIKQSRNQPANNNEYIPKTHQQSQHIGGSQPSINQNLLIQSSVCSNQNIHSSVADQTSRTLTSASRKNYSGKSLNKFVRRGCQFKMEQKTQHVQNSQKQINLQMRNILGRLKTKNICKRFVEKLKRNNIYSKPADFIGFQSQKSDTLFQKQGFQINKSLDNLISFFSIIQILVLFVSYTLALVFPEVNYYEFIHHMQIVSIFFSIFEIIYNCLTVKTSSGKKISSYGQILKNYVKSNMIIDIVILLILIINNSSQVQVMVYLRLFIIIKLPQCLQKLQKLEVYFIKNYYHEQYWSLMKLLIFNFGFAHLLAIILTGMAKANNDINWHVVRGITNAAWFEKYIWSYYWGCNIMLTVGFGDIAATNYNQATALIFIEIVSVMCLAYNINSIGTLISNIRSQDIQKFKNSKTIKQLSSKYNLPQELEWKINNYIEESVNIKKNFNIEQQKLFLENLPKDLKKQYLKESNKTIFENLLFFKNMMNKSLYALAQSIEVNICHPQQVIKKIQDNFNVYILRNGQVGLTSKKKGSSFNNIIIDSKKIKQNEKPFLLGLQFLTHKRNNYEIKSKQYSIIYCLDYQDLINAIKDTQIDYHHLCSLRDKNQINSDEHQVFVCEYCTKKKHTKFTCPKLHFIPLKEHVIHKQHFAYKTRKNKRNNLQKIRASSVKLNSLMNYISNKLVKNLNEGSERNLVKYSQLNKKQEIRRNTAKNINSDFNIIQEQRQRIRKATNYGQIINEQFVMMKKQQNFEDQIWIIKSDVLKDYKYYFNNNNPSSIQDSSLLNLKNIIDGIKITKHKTQMIKLENTLKRFDPSIKFIQSKKIIKSGDLDFHNQKSQ